MKQRNVLIFPAGTEIGLEIFRALCFCKEVRLFGAGQDISNHAKFIYPDYHNLPSIHEKGWINALNNLCQRYEIDYIFPAYDDVVVALSQEKANLISKVISSPALTCEITRSKSATYKYLAGDIRVPLLYESPAQINEFPVLVKPDKGQGSYGVVLIYDYGLLYESIQHLTDPIICEYLPGEEYTIDCFSDREQGLLFCGARSRRRTRNGISVNSVTENLPEANIIAQRISERFTLYGAWFFQMKRAKDGELTLLEIAPRIAGSMAVHRVKGINFPLLSIFEEERLPLSIQTIPGTVELDRALCNRYKHSIKYSTLYIDLDDTLIVHNKINIQAISLLFHCINEGKKIILITRHQQDLIKTLEKYRLTFLFDEVIHVDKERKKSFYIKENNSIYVDDSFSERIEVHKSCKIPTFDCSMIELLIN